MLAMHKDIQQKAYDEVKELSQCHDLNTLSYDAVAKLQYIEMIIKETLRLFPVDHMTLRTACAEIVLDNFRIPSGAKFVIPVFNVHRSASIWGEDANSFKPERFEYEHFASIHPYAFIPFTGSTKAHDNEINI
jgi:cytochrome P450